jgi:hypothetical protein
VRNSDDDDDDDDDNNNNNNNNVQGNSVNNPEIKYVSAKKKG